MFCVSNSDLNWMMTRARSNIFVLLCFLMILLLPKLVSRKWSLRMCQRANNEVQPTNQKPSTGDRQRKSVTWAENPGRVLEVQAGAAPCVGFEWREIWGNNCPADGDGCTMVTGGARPLFLGGKKLKIKRSGLDTQYWWWSYIPLTSLAKEFGKDKRDWQSHTDQDTEKAPSPWQ